MENQVGHRSSKIVLTDMEMKIAALVGRTRDEEAKKIGGKNPVGFKGDSVDVHIGGAAAEMAYCKFRDRYWPAGVNTFKDPDCGTVSQVRWTDLANGRLIVRPGDSPDHLYVLVIGVPPFLEVIGWIWGKDAMKEWYWAKPNRRPAAWFVPQGDLFRFPKL